MFRMKVRAMSAMTRLAQHKDPHHKTKPMIEKIFEEEDESALKKVDERKLIGVST